MLSGRSAKKALIKPLPPGLFTKSSFKRTSNNSFSGFDNLTVASTPPIKSTPRSSLVENKQEQSIDSIEDYTIVESDGDDEVFQDSTDRRTSLNSTVKRSSTSATKLSSLLASSPLNFVQKRKRKPVTPSTPVDSVKSGSLKLDGIDESSPVKKAKCAQFADQSTIFINRWKRLDKKSPHQKTREVNIPNNTTLVDQMKALIEKERNIRTVWRHSVTSQLKNKFKETINGKETLTMRLSNFICQFHVGFANGEIIEASIKQNYKVGDTVSLIFPSILCESMGFSNGTIVQFVSPWSVIMIRNRRFIINPFWIAVIERCTLKNEKKKSDDKEETLVTWSCPCQESFGNIDPLECNRAYSQSVGFC